MKPSTISNFLRKSTSAMILSGALISFTQSVQASDRRDFQIYNNNSQTITRLYITSTDPNVSWGNDILPGVLESGQFTTVRFRDNSRRCVYDIKVVYSDGSYDIGRQNVCKTYQLIFYGDGGDYAPR